MSKATALRARERLKSLKGKSQSLTDHTDGRKGQGLGDYEENVDSHLGQEYESEIALGPLGWKCPWAFM